MIIRANQAVELANETVTATGTGDSKTLPALGGGGILFTLRVATIANAVTDKLDVAIESTLDGTNWFEICAFTQILGNASAPKFEGWKLHAQGAEASVLDLTAAVGAAAKIDAYGTVFRAKWTVTDVDAPSFGIVVHACPMP